MADSMRPKAEIEAEIEAARDRLATGLASLINEIHPRAIAHRAAADARSAASSRLRALKSQLVQPDGSLNLTRAGLLAAAAAGSIAFVAIVRSIVRR
jgi:hypothetical protein